MDRSASSPENRPRLGVEGGTSRSRFRDGQQGVLVDGVLVVEVTHHATVDPLKLRKHPAEQAAVVHFRQPVVEAGPRFQEPEQGVAFDGGWKEVVRGKTVDVLLDQRQRFIGDLGLVVDRGLKRVNPRVRLPRGALRVHEPDAVPRPDEIHADGRRRRLTRPVERAAHESRVPEIVAHEALDALLWLRAGVSEELRRLLLQLVAEDVLVALSFQVHDGADAQQEVFRFVQPRGIDRAAIEQSGIGEPRDGPRCQKIAKRSRGVLDVGFQLVQRAVEVGVTRINQRLQGREDRRVRVRPVKRGRETRVDARVADDAPRVQQGEREFRIVGLQPRKVSELADLVTDHELKIPQRMEKSAQETLVAGVERPFEEDQDVDVGKQRQMPPAVASKGQDGDRLRRLRCFEEQALQQRVDPVGVALDRCPAGGTLRRLADQFLPRPFEQRGQTGG